jgi:Family of unknown function (DUF5681)
VTDRADNPANPAKTGRLPDGRFAPGSSHNPKGRPQGSRHKTSLMLEKIMAADAEAIVRKIVETAKSGDLTAGRIVTDRLYPIPRDRPIKFELPAIATADDAAGALSSVLKSVAAGEISLSEAQGVASLIETWRKAVEMVVLEARVTELERSRTDGKRP